MHGSYVAELQGKPARGHFVKKNIPHKIMNIDYYYFSRIHIHIDRVLRELQDKSARGHFVKENIPHKIMSIDYYYFSRMHIHIAETYYNSCYYSKLNKYR
jgi:hypothetical protein